MANNFLGGNRQTSNSRFLRLLQANRNLNTGTTTGGLAHVLNMAARGYASGVDRNQETASNEAMSKAAALMQGVPDAQIQWDTARPDGSGDMVTDVPGVKPNMQGAIGVLSNNPKFAPLAMQLQMGQNAKKEAAATKEFDYNRNLAEKESDRLKGLESSISAAGEKHERDLELLDVKNAHALDLKKQGYASGYSSRPSAILQILNKQNKLRDDRKTAFKNNDTESVAEIDREVKRLDVLIAKDPNYKGAIAAATKSGTGIGEKTTKRYYQARYAKYNIQDIDALTTRLRAVDGSTIGFMSDINKLKNKVVASFGGKEAMKKVSDVEMINALMGAEVFPLIKALGIGARGMDTPAEREFMREVLTGSTTLTVETLLAMAAKRRAAQVRSVNDWNKQLESGELDNFYRTNNLINRPFAVPSGALDGNGGYRPPLSSFERK
jgi:hypothetical protein